MIFCRTCKVRREPVDGVCPTCHRILSDPTASVGDDLIEQASTPSLSTLFKQAKNRGFIRPAFQYHNSNRG